MVNKTRMWRVLLCIVPLVLVVIYGPTLAATAHAEWDISHGCYRMTEYGLLTVDWASYQTLLQQRYGVSVSAGGCIMPFNYNQVEAYNNVVRNSLRRKYHRDIFAECAAASRPQRR